MNTPLRNDEATLMRHLGRYLQTLLLASVLFAMLSSCTDDLSVSPEESSMDRVPVLASSASDVQLDMVRFNQTAVEFTWSRGSNHGTLPSRRGFSTTRWRSPLRAATSRSRSS